jgi:C-terminal processing protease CtpA/Prc
MRFLDHLWPLMLAPALFVLMATTIRDAVQAHEFMDPQGLYARVWQEIRNIYVDSTFNGQDWAAWEHKFDGQLKSPEESYKAIQTMLGSLQDPYTRIAPPQPEKPPEAELPVAKMVSESTAPPVSSHILDGNIGYIKVSSFGSLASAKQFRTELQKYADAKGIIMDLRGNKGGLVVVALEIADMFLEGGTIVTTVSRQERLTQTASGDRISDQPLVVLVDQNSASASEILAGALKDHHRATIIGTKTFGKGLIQEVIQVPGGAVLYVTEAHYLTPSGSDIHKIGILPDITETNEAHEVDTAVQFLEGKRTTAIAPIAVPDSGS